MQGQCSSISLPIHLFLIRTNPENVHLSIRHVEIANLNRGVEINQLARRHIDKFSLDREHPHEVHYRQNIWQRREKEIQRKMNCCT